MLNKLILIFIIFSTSCSHDGLKRRNLDEYFIGTGVVKYFLPDLPTWANFSVSGQCHRQENNRYFNYKKLRTSFAMGYEEAVQLQLMYNNEVNNIKIDSNIEVIPFREEERIFYATNDKIQAGIRTFKAPIYKKINVVWIDRAIENKSLQLRLKKLMDSCNC